MKDKLSSVGFGKNKKTGLLFLVLITIPIVVGGLAHVQNQNNKKNTQVLGANEAQDMVKKVGKLMDLPNETPTVATVSDVTKLQNQAFFAKAQNGDKVLIFPKAQKAVLYRPATDKLIEVAFYSPPAETPTIAPTAVLTPTPATSLLNLLKKPTVKPTPQVSPSVGKAISPAPSIPAPSL